MIPPLPHGRYPLLFHRIAYLLLAGDIAVLWLSFNIASFLRLGGWLEILAWPLIGPIAILLLSLYVFDTYAPERFVSGIWAAVRSVVAVIVGGVLVSLFVYFAGLWGQHTIFGRGIFTAALLVFLPWTVFSRHYSANWAARYRRRTKWLVLGTGESVRLLYADCLKGGASMDFLALDPKTAAASGLPCMQATLGDLDRLDLPAYAGLVLAKELTMEDALAKKLMWLRMQGVRIYDISDFYESLWHKVPVLHLNQGWFVLTPGFDLLHNPVGMRLKRVLDIAFASLGLLVVIPLVLVVGVAIRLESPGPVIYRQERKGENGRLFVLYKLRSMHVNHDAGLEAKWTLPGDPRITRVGRLIRLVRLDEMPQLLNVLRGDMSFIGPRPEARELTELYEGEIPFYDLRYLVRPGITGWAQVMYPYGSSVEDAREKLQYDLFYIKNYSLLLDLAILLKTIRVVLFGKGR